MSILIDTNVLLRRTQPDHPHHVAAVESVAHLLETGEPVYYALQNIAEFWNIATRSIASHGLSFSPALALGEVGKIEQALMLLPEAPAMYGESKRLMIQHHVLGSKCMTPG